MRLCVLAATALVALGAASTAQAKGLIPARICGESGCVAVENQRGTVVTLAQGSVSVPPPAPFVRIEYEVAGAGPHYLLPSTGYLAEAGGGAWYRLEPRALPAVRRAARDVKPYEAPREWDEILAGAETGRTRGDTPVAWIATALLILVAAVVAGWRTRLQSPSAARKATAEQGRFAPSRSFLHLRHGAEARDSPIRRPRRVDRARLRH
jgi:hypothetical protein